jgi:hypothetical protein
MRQQRVLEKGRKKDLKRFGEDVELSIFATRFETDTPVKGGRRERNRG